MTLAQQTILPPSASSTERAFDLAYAARLSAVRTLVPSLWNADTCPASLLPWLAWALSVDDWDADWPEQMKRNACREAVEIHEHKGTPAAIKRALAVRGHGDAILLERSNSIAHDGRVTARTGIHRRGGNGHWATYTVILQRPVTIDQAESIKRMLLNVRRNCCHLVELNYTRAALGHNGFAQRNGTYTRGTVAPGA